MQPAVTARSDVGFEACEVRRAFRGRGGRLVNAVDGVTLSIAAREAVVLIGPSGAGKTTLLRLLGGAIGPTGGIVRFQGRSFSDLDAAQLREARSRIGFVAQRHNLVERLRVWQNVLAGRLGRKTTLGALKMFFAPSREELAAARASLGRMGIEDLLNARVDELSGGQAQRVAIARVLVQQPPAILGDEPVASVDPRLGSEIVGQLRSIAAAAGATLVLSLHDVSLALNHFPRIVGIRDGRVHFDAPARKVDRELLRALYAGDPTSQELTADGVGLPTSRQVLQVAGD